MPFQLIRGTMPFNAQSMRMDGNRVWSQYWGRLKSVMDGLGFNFDDEKRDAVRIRIDGAETFVERADAGEAYFLEQQLRYVMTERLQEDRAPNKAALFLPIDSSMPSGAETHVYRIIRTAGSARIITDYSDDLPPVDVTQSEVAGKVVSIGTSFGYSIQDLRNAAFSGQPLERDRMDAAANEIDNTMDELASFGSVANNLPGFLNNPNIPVVVLPTGNWPTATPKQILSDLRYMEETIAQAVFHKADLMPDTALFDSVSWQILRQEVNDFTEKSILQRFLDSSETVKNADVWHRLDKADAARTGPRSVMYRRDPSIIRMIVPQAMEMLPPQPKNMAFVVPVHARIGGVDVRKPYTAAYTDSVD